MAVIIIIAAVFLGAAGILYARKDRIRFGAACGKAGLSRADARALWQLAQRTGAFDVTALFGSVPELDRAITALIADSRARRTDTTASCRRLLAGLYGLRTRADLERGDERMMRSTRELEKGQSLRIILPGHGVFRSEVIGNDADVVAGLPVRDGAAAVGMEQWLRRRVSVYLWRKGDAGYVFDTEVVSAGLFGGVPAIYLRHTRRLQRAQKRRSVRARCGIAADLYPGLADDSVEMARGRACWLEDISEDGALIRVDGTAEGIAAAKIQFDLNGTLIVMAGEVRAAEHDGATGRSRLHFECRRISDDRRNAVLSFVYGTLPQEEKEVLEALGGTEAEGARDKRVYPPPLNSGQVGAEEGHTEE